MSDDFAQLQQAFRTAFQRATRWMLENEAEVLVENLAPAADAATLDGAEERLGFPLPIELRALWSVHDGQNEEQNGFCESYDLLSTDQADAKDVTLSLPFLREPASARAVAESKMTPAELASEKWIRVCGRDSDGIAVNAESGRVFHHVHDDVPALRLIAPSVLAWFSAYTSKVAAGDYRIEEGFGDCYLEERDRAAEEREDKRKAEEKARQARPSLDLLDELIAKKHDSRLLEALLRTKDGEREAFLAALFAKASPELVASTVRAKANELTLTRAQWQVVAAGAAMIPNNALKALAEKKSKEA